MPPSEEMKILHELAMLGNMRAIKERAIYLKKLELKYFAFANKLEELAQNFEEKEILTLIEKAIADGE